MSPDDDPSNSSNCPSIKMNEQNMNERNGGGWRNNINNPSTNHHNYQNGNNQQQQKQQQQQQQQQQNGKWNTTNNGYNSTIKNSSTISTNGNYINGNTENLNGNSNGNDRRNSTTHAWSPLLECEISIKDDNITYNKNIKNEKSNNNLDWKESEEMNNIKNNLHKTHNNNHNGNNNGSMLLNGKNMLDINCKLNENDPLTGLCKPKKLCRMNSTSSNSSNNSSSDDDTDSDGNLNKNDNETNCGILNFHPKWAKNFASTHMFMIVFLLAWVLQGMYLTYFVSCITTIEKLFQIKSKTTGMLMSASEIGQICTAMLLTYYAGRGHRPRWIAVGMVIFSIASFGCSLPHFIFGKQLLQSNTFSLVNNNLLQQQQQQQQQHLKDINSLELSSSSVSFLLSNNETTNATTFIIKDTFNLCVISNNSMKFNEDQECEEDVKQEQASQTEITNIVLYIFFASLLMSGVGQTAVSTLGIPYIDDNVASRESPIYLAITIGVRILGPALGFIVGSFAARVYVDLSDPGIDPTDPKWISAWWLGPVIIGTLMLLSSIAMFSFPKQLRGNRIMSPNHTEKTEIKPDTPPSTPVQDVRPKLKDFPKTVRRQLSNDILMFRTASSVFHILPIAGLYTFLPKYLETQFRLPAADAALISAFGGILVMGIGIVISGIVILKFNPTARSVAAWIAFTAFIYACGMGILMFVGCNMNDFAGLSKHTDNTITKFEPPCNTTCSCDLNKFEPICGADGQTYFSSCHAGCSGVEKGKDGKDVFVNCECIPDYLEDETYQAISGYCDNNCKSFVLFLCLFAFFVFIHSTSEVGSMLLIMRCTDPKDKAMAMGVIQSAIGLFGNVPCPIIYGAVVDSACLVWKTVCGKPGACSLYDVDVFRHYFLGITASIMMLAFIMDLIVWKKANRIDIAPTETSESETDYEKSKPSPDTTV